MSLLRALVRLGPVVASLIAGPAPACDTDSASSARVEEIYPTAGELPGNLLRFYVYFTRPMARGDVLQAIELQTDGGRPIPEVFLANRYELWSPDNRRLTLILDPGRVKTGLTSHQSRGRALTAGRRYVLSVRPSALDAAGCPIAEGFEKTFTATAEDRSPPEIDRWRFEVPSAGTRQPLAVELDGPYDHLSLAYRLRVRDESGHVVAGSIELAEHESRWLFTPAAPWRVTGYRLAVEPSLEDLAGNRPGRPFDLEPAGGETQPPILPSPSLEISFEISSAPNRP